MTHTLEELKALPLGSVIGWSAYYDGDHFGVAVLELPMTDDEPFWCVSGDPQDYTAEELHYNLRGEWEYMGKITPDSESM